MSNDFMQFIIERGLIVDHLIRGRWVRVGTVDHPHKKNGAYWYGGDFGHVKNWGTMEDTESWFDSRPMKPYEKADMERRIKEAKKRDAEERGERARQAAGMAQWMLDRAYLATHAYMDKKGFPKDEVLCLKHNKEAIQVMLIPMYKKGILCGLQHIDIDGKKKFLSGQFTRGAYFEFSNESQRRRIYLVEGYATGRSLKVVLDSMKAKYSIFVCFSAGNMKYIASAVPKAKLICDHDKTGVGLKVALESGNKYWISPVEGEDFNDYWQRMGTLKSNISLRNFVFDL